MTWIFLMCLLIAASQQVNSAHYTNEYQSEVYKNHKDTPDESRRVQ